jgi:hypothetical protein
VKNDLSFLGNDRSFARLSERFCHEPRRVDFDTCWKNNTIYNGIKIVVPKGKTLVEAGGGEPREQHPGGEAHDQSNLNTRSWYRISYTDWVLVSLLFHCLINLLPASPFHFRFFVTQNPSVILAKAFVLRGIHRSWIRRL